MLGWAGVCQYSNTLLFESIFHWGGLKTVLFLIMGKGYPRPLSSSMVSARKVRCLERQRKLLVGLKNGQYLHGGG